MCTVCGIVNIMPVAKHIGRKGEMLKIYEVEKVFGSTDLDLKIKRIKVLKMYQSTNLDL